MITEVIRRGHRKGYDENGNLVYKILITDEASAAVEEVQEEIQDEEAEEVAPTFPFTTGE